jgi:hypothetical protein
MKQQRPMDTKPIRWLIAPFLIVAIAGCHDASGPKATENLGVLLVSDVSSDYYIFANPVWTRDGGELVYVGAPTSGTGYSALHAVNISTQAVRQLVASEFITKVVRSGAGERIYFGSALTSNPNFRASRVHPLSGAVENLVTTDVANDFMEVSADERFLVFDRRLFDLQTGGQRTLPPGTPFGFSPDGTQLLYYEAQPGTSISAPTLISTADGSSQTLHSTGYFHLAHRWEGNSPQLLMTESNFIGGRSNYTYRISEIDGLSGATHDIAQFSTTDSQNPYSVNWSADGRTLALWIHQGEIADGTSRTNLYIIRTGNAPTLVATATPSFEVGPPGPPVLSPSGNSVAYFYYHPDDRRSLYLKSGF